MAGHIGFVRMDVEKIVRSSTSSEVQSLGKIVVELIAHIEKLERDVDHFKEKERLERMRPRRI